MRHTFTGRRSVSLLTIPAFEGNTSPRFCRAGESRGGRLSVLLPEVIE